MKEFKIQWGGGLGDMFNNMYKGGQYAALDYIPPDFLVHIILFCHNPSVTEIFDHHPKKNQLKVVNHGFQKVEDIQKMSQDGIIPMHLPPLPGLPNKAVNWYKPTNYYYPNKLRDLKYIVLSTTGSDPAKNIPEPLVEKIVSKLIELNYYVVPVGKNYVSVDSHQSNRTEHEFPKNKKIINLVDKLTVPETAQVLQTAQGCVCCHSAINILAWYLKIPQILLYNKAWDKKHGFSDPEFIDQWSFGKNYDNTIHGLFDDYTEDMLEKFIEKIR